MGTVPSSQPSLALITMKIILSVCLSIALTAAFPADKVTPEKVDDDSFIEEQGKFGYGYSHHQPGSHHHVSFYQQDPQHHSYNHESYKPKCETVYETSYTTVTEKKCVRLSTRRNARLNTRRRMRRSVRQVTRSFALGTASRGSVRRSLRGAAPRFQ